MNDDNFPDCGRLSRVKAVFLDMDGTIYWGRKLFPTTAPFLDFLTQHHISYTFCTNNSTLSHAGYAEKLQNMGLKVKEDNFYTSTDFLIYTLRHDYPAVKKIYLLGVPVMAETMREAGFELTPDNPDALVVSFDQTLDYRRLCHAAWLLRSGIPGFSTHPDFFCPTDTPTVLVDCGAISRCVELAAGKPLIQLGKPCAGFLRCAAGLLGVAPADTLMIGDRLATDIASGINAGTLTCRIHGPGADPAPGNGEKPDFSCRDLGRLQRIWQKIIIHEPEF